MGNAVLNVCLYFCSHFSNSTNTEKKTNKMRTRKLMMLVALLMAGLTCSAQNNSELVSVPADATIETWHIDGVRSAFYLYDSYESNWFDATGYMATLDVAVSGNEVYIRGLAYWFYDAWVRGTLGDDGVVTFPERTFVGEDEYGSEYIVGSTDGEQTSTFSFAYDADAKTLTLNQGTYILEIGEDIADGYFSFWSGLSLGHAEAVVPPADLQTEEYTFTAQTLRTDDEGEPYNEPASFSVHVGLI